MYVVHLDNMDNKLYNCANNSVAVWKNNTRKLKEKNDILKYGEAPQQMEGPVELWNGANNDC